jgi:hypothetical protein
LSLEELDLEEMEDSQNILWSLRENGSLRLVSIPDEMETHFANAYCLRNKRIGPLMKSLAWTESSDGQTMVENVHSTAEDRCSLALLPSLLQSAKPISMTGATKVFCGLMNLGESIGPM